MDNFFLQRYPDMAAFAQNQVSIPGKMEVIWQPLYDRLLYPTAGVAGALTFFSQPVGSGQSTEDGTVAGTLKSLADTNMTQQGQLPSPQAFFCTGMEFKVDAGDVSTANTFSTIPPTFYNATGAATVQAGLNDENAIYKSGVVNLTVADKSYFRLAPLGAFPQSAKARADVAAATAGTNAQPNAFGAQFMFIDGEPRYFDPGFGIPTGMNFAVTVSWAALVATAANNARIQCQLKGWLFRAAQ